MIYKDPQRANMANNKLFSKNNAIQVDNYIFGILGFGQFVGEEDIIRELSYY